MPYSWGAANASRGRSAAALSSPEGKSYTSFAFSAGIAAPPDATAAATADFTSDSCPTESVTPARPSMSPEAAVTAR